jgi:hypothetical protein
VRRSQNAVRAKFAEFTSLLKNTLCARFHPESGIKYADFGAFRVRFVVAFSSMPTFSTVIHGPYRATPKL